MEKILECPIENKPQRPSGQTGLNINTPRLRASAVYLLTLMALATTIWPACSKDEPPEAGFDTPVFSVGFEADSSSNASLTAGKDGIYLFTRVGPDPFNVLVMSGAFADAGCPTGDCPGSVKFEFRNEWLENFVRPELIFSSDRFWEYKASPTDSSLNTVAIQWVKPNGNVLRSDRSIQLDTFSHFIILKSEPWETNERGEKTWKMNVDFSCWMFDSTQNQDQKIMGSGVIAVGYR